MLAAVAADRPAFAFECAIRFDSEDTMLAPANAPRRECGDTIGKEVMEADAVALVACAVGECCRC